MNTESRIERDRIPSKATSQIQTAQVPITQADVISVNGPPQNAGTDFTDGSETPSNASALQLKTAKVSPAQVEKRSVEEINRERAEKLLAGGSVSSPVQNTYRPSSSGFTYLQGNCPVCSGARRDCRQSNASGLIFCRGQATNSSWGFIKEDSNGFGIYKNGLKGDRSYTYQPTLPKPVKNRLSDPERSRQFKQIAKHSGLSSQHRAKLEHRGLNSTTIDTFYTSSLVWTWANNEQIPVTTSELPGINPRSGRLREEFWGMAIAIPSITGHILGAQIKPDNGDGYFWVSSDSIGGNGPRLSNDELPIGVYGHQQKTINFCEGYLKSAIAAEWHGLLSVGSAGGGWANSPEQLKAIIETTGADNFILNPDGGMLDEKHKTVITAYSRLNELLQSWGYTLQVRWWGQSTKIDGDIDEISSETYKGAQLISWDEFIEKLEYEYQEIQSSQSVQEDNEPSRVDRAIEGWVPFLSEQGDSRQYFGDAVVGTLEKIWHDGDRALIVQAGPPNTGKSTSAKAAREVGKRRDREFIAITPLESSAKGMADDLDIPYRKDNFKGSQSFAMCTNALRPDAQNVDWNKLGDQTDTLMDEASESNQLTSGLKAEATMKRKVEQKVLSGSQTVTAQSATLKQYDIDFYQHLGGFKDEQIHIDAIRTAPHPKNITIYHKARSVTEGNGNSGGNSQGEMDPKPQLLFDTFERVKAGKTAEVISVDSQKPFSRWGTWGLEELAKDAGIPVERIERFDSQTNKDINHPAYKTAKSGYLLLQPGTLYITSPANETNMSYIADQSVQEVNHTTFDTGSMTVERIYQSCRVRGRDGLVINQHIAIGDYIGRLPHGDAFTPDDVWADIQQQASNGQAQQFHRLMGGGPLDKDNPTVRDYCIRQADKACSLVGKHRILPELLASQGHCVMLGTVRNDEQLRTFKTQIEEGREVIKQSFYAETRHAKQITTETYEARQKKGEYSCQEWIEMQRFQTERILGNHPTEKVKDGAIIECDEGVALTEELIDAVCARRLVPGWRRTYDALYGTRFDWFVKSVRQLDGETPSLIDSCRSRYTQFTLLDDLGIIAFVRKRAIVETLPEFDYIGLLQDKKPSDAFQTKMVKHFKDSAFTYQDPEFQTIVEKLSQPDELERVTALLGIRGITRNAEGNVTATNVMTLIRRFFGVRTLRSNSVRISGVKGATILTLDDRAHDLYSLYLAADKVDKPERLEMGHLIGDAIENVTRSIMFSTWEESRKVSGAIALKNVPLLQKLESLSIGNNGTSSAIDFSTWVEGIGVPIDRPLEVSERVQRTDKAGWGGVIKSILGKTANVLFDLEQMTKAVPIDLLARV